MVDPWVDPENVAARGFLHALGILHHVHVGITDHNATRLDDYTRPLPYLLTSVTPIFFSKSASSPHRHMHVRATTTARDVARGAPAAPAGPGTTVGHRLAAPDPTGAASGPRDAPNGVDLELRDRRHHEQRHSRPRGGLEATSAAGERTPRAPRTPSTLPATARPAAAAAASVRRPLRPTRAAAQPPPGGHLGAPRRRCDGAATCATAADRAG